MQREATIRGNRIETQIYRRLGALLAHDLRNPLQSLTILLELIQDDFQPHNPEVASRVDQCLEASVRMRDLLRNYATLVREPLGDTIREGLGIALKRCLGVLEDRHQRGVVAIERDTASVDFRYVAIESLDDTLIGLFLAIITALRDTRVNTTTLNIVGQAQGPNSEIALRVHAENVALKSDTLESIFHGARSRGLRIEAPIQSSETALDLTIWIPTEPRSCETKI